MQLWFGEACGNTFLLVVVRQESETAVGLFLDNLRKNDQWRFDTALVVTLVGTYGAQMRVLERDGSESAMCGNGVRVVGHVLDQLHIPRLVQVKTTSVAVHRDRPGVYSAQLDIARCGILRIPGCPEFRLYRVAGEPHAVAVVPNVAAVPLGKWGSRVVPSANCTVVSVEDAGILRACTYERGVNAVTQSCGTGACAAAQAVHDHLYSRVSTLGYNVRMHTFEMGVHLMPEGAILSGRVSSTQLQLNGGYYEPAGAYGRSECALGCAAEASGPRRSRTFGTPRSAYGRSFFPTPQGKRTAYCHA
jgi:diaminopimelate epimerase